MIKCPCCGNELNDGSRFCNTCGAAIAPPPSVAPAPQTTVPPVMPTYQPPVQPVMYAPVPPVAVPTQPAGQTEAQEFVETTRRLLRWEQKAWKITGIVLTAVVAAVAALFILLGFIFFCIAAAEGEEFAGFGVMYIVYAIYYGIMLAPIAVINLVSAKKIPYYLDTMDRDFASTAKRCNSVGMLVFTVFFNEVALVFFLINFVRMKSNRRLVEAITGQQI